MKKPFYVVTWGNDRLTPGNNYWICAQADTLRGAKRKVTICDQDPRSAKRHRIFIVKEVKSH